MQLVIIIYQLALIVKFQKNQLVLAVSLIDKIDILVGFFGINEKPTSSKDPFALRRTAIGLLRIIIENKLKYSIKRFN